MEAQRLGTEACSWSIARVGHVFALLKMYWAGDQSGLYVKNRANNIKLSILSDFLYFTNIYF
jgi:hypothetical protein